MHRLEITGETPEALYFNSVKMLSLLLRGAGEVPPTVTPFRSGETEPSAGAETGAAVEGPSPSGTGQREQEVAPPVKPKRGKAAKEAASEKMPDDPLPDVMTGGKTIEHDPREVDGEPPTLDGDIRPRLRAIQAAHSARGHAMPACVAYIQKLYGPFGISKADQLKPEQFEEFMDASEAYLSGEA